MRHLYAIGLLIILLFSVSPAVADGPATIIDTYDADPRGMARPGKITFGIYNCNLIETQPSDVRTTYGGNARLYVELQPSAAGATVEWYKGDRNDPASTLVGEGADFTLTGVTADGKYWALVMATDDVCRSSSNTINVTVCKPAQVTFPSQDVVTELNTGRTQQNHLNINVQGDSLRFAWKQKKQGVTTETALGSSEDIVWTAPDQAAVGDIYEISVVVTGACGSPVTRVVAKFKIIEGSSCEPVILTSFPGEWPIYQEGDSATLRITMAGGTSAQYEYRWFINDEPVSDFVSGGPSSEFTVVYSGVAITVHVRKAGCADVEARTTYVWFIDSCPVPPLRLNKTHINLNEPDVNRQVIAHSDWPSVSFQWYKGDSGNTRVEIDSDPEYLGGGALTVEAIPGTYWVRTTSQCGTYTDSPTVVVANNACSPVRIMRQPVSADIPAGAPHTLTVDATGSPAPIYYQWTSGRDDVQELGRARAQTVQPLRTTTYAVRVSNGCHETHSTFATLRVTSCSEIALATPPQSDTYRVGDAVNLSVAASGSTPLHYQWFQGESGDDSLPVGTDSPNFSITASDTTKYWVRLHFNDTTRCAVDSPAATITVCKSPVLTQNLGNASSTVPGIEHWLSASATGANLKYQWYRDSIAPENKLGGGRSIRVSPLVTTRYFIEVKSECALDTEAATGSLLISVCPTFLTQPSALQPMVMPGTGTTLTVSVNAGAPTYQWYRGVVNTDRTNPVGTASSSPNLVTGPITADTTYWVLVTSGMCERPSETVTVETCKQPLVSWSSGQSQAYSGQSQMLGVSVQPDATRLTYYKGNKGDTSQLVAGPTPNRAVQVAPTTTTKYWARAELEGTICYHDTQEFTVSVCIPKITTQPLATQMLDKTQNPNASKTLSVTATGDNLTYQWYIGSPGVTTNPIAGATSSSVTLSPNAETTYWVRVSGNCGISENSTAAVITVCQVPVITAQPTTGEVSANTPTTIYVTATGTGLHYQWYRGLPGDTSTPIGTDLSYTTVTISVTTKYWVKITGACGTAVNSAAGILSVKPVVTPLANRNVTKNTSTTFTVSATGTYLTYQWYYAPNTLISGATSASFTTPALTVDTTVWVRVTSEQASASTTPVTAYIYQPKAVSVSQPSNVSGSNVTLSIVGPDGNESYSWYRGNTGDTSVPLGGGTARIVAPDATTNYWVQNAGYGCTANSPTVTVNVCVPRITSQPTGGMVNPGNTIRLSVSAVGTPALTYQWYTAAGSAVSGATGTFYDAPWGNASYYVRVSSPGGSCYVNSNTVAVQACQVSAITAQPVSVNTVHAGSASLSVTATGTNLTYQWYRGASGVTTYPVGTNSATLSLTNVVATDDYWVRVTAQCGSAVNSQSAKVSIPPTVSGETVKYVSTGQSATFTVSASGNQLSYVWYQGSTPQANGSGATFTTPALTADTNYWVRVYSGNAYKDSSYFYAIVCKPKTVSVWQPSQESGSQVTLTVTDPLGDESYVWYVGGQSAATGTSLTVYPVGTTAYTVRATRGSCVADKIVTVTVCYPKINTQPQYMMVNPGQTATVSVSAQGSTPLSYQWYAGYSGDTTYPISGATGASYSWVPNGSTAIWVRVWSAQGGGCYVNSAATTVELCQPPAITQQPQSTIIYNTDTVTLPVGATGTDLTYQWYENTSGSNVLLSGATSSTLVIQPGTTRSFWVRVTGRCGYVDSAVALQSVRPNITAQPANTAACAGATASFSIGATGSGLSYRWFEGSSGQFGTQLGTASTLSLTLTANKTVWCEVRSGNAIVNSTAATATVTAGPAVGVWKGWMGWGDNYYLTASVPSELQGYVTYRWYQGPIGNASQLIGESATIMVWAPSTTWYWVRVWDSQTGCWTDRAISAPY